MIVTECLEDRRLLSASDVHVILPHHDQGPITEPFITVAATPSATSTSTSTPATGSLYGFKFLPIYPRPLNA